MQEFPKEENNTRYECNDEEVSCPQCCHRHCVTFETNGSDRKAGMRTRRISKKNIRYT